MLVDFDVTWSEFISKGYATFPFSLAGRRGWQLFLPRNNSLKFIPIRHPLLMEQLTNSADQHVIDIARGGTASPSASVPHGDAHDDNGNRPSIAAQVPGQQSSSLSSAASTSRNVSISRRGDNSDHRHRSPLNSGLWISVELAVNVSQIIAAIVVLPVSKDEHPRAPLFAWIVGYTAGCFATLPHLYWRYVHRNYQGSEQGLLRRSSSQNNSPEPTSYSAISVAQAVEEHNNNMMPTVSHSGRNSINASPRLNAFVDHFKMALDCFFAVWFVVGNVWVFGGHSSASDAPNLYRLCIVFLTFSCIGYAMPFVLCAMICCCLPCIISIMGFREDTGQNRGATSESINALPTYKFKSKSLNGEKSEANFDGPGEGGILAAGTDKERTLSAEDAVCCICLAKYANDDDLHELPCTHCFHMECVDKWLKINALCPLCKSEVGNAVAAVSGTNPVRRYNDRRVGSGVESEQEVQ
ncbi:E3 ubiquitin-protein ligase-like [Iris pallida]|uniref:E3 ubiquitin-protein ligase-like n=1 Tax=Iris pallida TaxID=29817 RepID=A0AAX6F526_IRIPA|nr:E3 ubiquitin-protein ligase-like [Iris pallida]